MNTIKKTKVVIIDSGISSKWKFQNCVKSSYFVDKESGEIKVENDPVDLIGHGTAIAEVICQNNSEVDIISIRLCDAEIEMDENGLIIALSYIYNYIDADIINISAGITYIYNYTKLYGICNKLNQKGVIIVSAFDNDGAVSFPSAFDNVIGVDVTNEYEDKTDLILVKQSIVNIYVANIYYRISWNGKKTIIKGTSFAAAKVTALLAKEIAKKDNILRNKDDLLDAIANRKKSRLATEKIDVPTVQIKKAILFPINKESSVLLRYRKLLNFEIIGVYDDKFSGNIGKVLFDEVVQPYENIDWNADFDTVILSCTSELERITKKNYCSEILDRTKKKRKFIYSFEKLDTDYKKYFYPEVLGGMVNSKNDLKMNKVSKPVVCVLGTSSKQGKYSLQLELVSRMKMLGYNVGHIATEPSGYLFGADYVFHSGYHSYLSVQPWESISIINRMIFETQIKGRDIIITGGQSGMLHYNNSLIEHFALYQYAYLLGVMPDLIVLCINPHDDLEYIERTINFVDSVDEGKIVALVLYPIEAIELDSGISFKSISLSIEAIKQKKSELFEKFGNQVYLLGNADDMDNLCKQIIEFFSTDEEI